MTISGQRKKKQAKKPDSFFHGTAITWYGRGPAFSETEKKSRKKNHILLTKLFFGKQCAVQIMWISR